MRFKNLNKNLNKKTPSESGNKGPSQTIAPPSIDNPQSMSAQQLLYLQKNIGNQALGEMLSGKSSENNKPSNSKPDVSPLQAADTPAGKASKQAFKAEIPALVSAGKTLEEGESISFPDVKVSIELGDSISGIIAYKSSNTQSGTPGASEFGVTRCYLSLTGLSATLGGGVYIVNGDFNNDISYCACASTGPDGQKNILSDSDSNITAANYTTVSSDLTPDTSDLGGRPPRTQFWSKALTLQHEQFHANEYSVFGSQGFTAALAWLNLQTAANARELHTALSAIPDRVINSINTAMPYPAKEERAYGDGVAGYTALAKSIKDKGDKGDYGEE